jgi:hypothetical protein
MIGILPFVFLLTLLATAGITYSGFFKYRRLKGGHPPGWNQILLVSIPLLVVDGLVCLYILLSAALSHSERLIRLAPVKCGTATAVIFVLPMIVLILYRPKR